VPPPKRKLRGDRVSAVVDGNFGRVIGREGVMMVEVPADVAIGLHAIWGQGEFLPIFTGADNAASPVPGSPI
jgi:hypothetical protein